ncbi:MAG: NADH:ubiquinone oxidoreductase subunit J [Alphaproteobacteria bacterium]|jgi:NADH-quinone oxidoreductase subunit J|nr:NADH:ubiquinone oxidoreductase subunit J [Alphaproteobacteria bacterium]PPR12643.1 MAG: NADH-quinone oxidoreductase subunit J [Alphaproteobacteria bacterium MarineAlpha12_Bin1]
MIISSLAFYLFSFITIFSAVMVISARNPVHSVLFLILAFFNSAGLFVLLGAEFLAMILVVVYVGAVAVLFLFVVMMLDINFVELREGFLQYLPIGALVGIILMAELVLIFGSWVINPSSESIVTTSIVYNSDTTNTHALGQLIYTHYIYLFQAAGLLLLVAMIGAIVLTVRKRPTVKRQNISEQVAVRVDDVIEVKDVTSGSGI